MANKYIDHLTLEEYELLLDQLDKRLVDLNAQVIPNEKTQANQEYIKAKFLQIKIKAIIKKYERKKEEKR